MQTKSSLNIEAARELLAEHGIEILPNLDVRVRTGRDRWENVGSYETEADAIAAAVECAKDRNGGHL